MMSQGGPNGHAFLCKPELDAFIAQALSPKLTDSQYLQDLQVGRRGVLWLSCWCRLCCNRWP